jgi:alkylhydroperoxidase family enzyme
MQLLDLAATPDDPETRAVFARIAESRGWVSNAMRSLAAAPEGLKAFSAVGHYGRYGTDLTELQRELVILLIGRGVPYAWAHHVPLGLQAGLTQPQIDAIAAQAMPPGLSPENQTICDYVHAFAAGKGVGPALATRMRQHFSARQITDLSLLAGYYMALGHMLVAFGVAVEPPEVLAIELDWQRRQGAKT